MQPKQGCHERGRGQGVHGQGRGGVHGGADRVRAEEVERPMGAHRQRRGCLHENGDCLLTGNWYW